MKTALKITLLTALFFAISEITLSQTFVKQADDKGNPQIKIHYDQNSGGNRPNARIEFADNFNKISWLNAVCEGDYSWCIRDEENNDMGYLKFTFSGNKLIVDIKLEERYPKENLTESIKAHLMALKGIYIKSGK